MGTLRMLAMFSLPTLLETLSILCPICKWILTPGSRYSRADMDPSKIWTLTMQLIGSGDSLYGSGNGVKRVYAVGVPGEQDCVWSRAWLDNVTLLARCYTETDFYHRLLVYLRSCLFLFQAYLYKGRQSYILRFRHMKMYLLIHSYLPNSTVL